MTTLTPSYDSFMDDFLMPLLFPNDMYDTDNTVVVDSELLYEQIATLLNKYFATHAHPVHLAEDGYYELSVTMHDLREDICQLLIETLPEELEKRDNEICSLIEEWLVNWLVPCFF